MLTKKFIIGIEPFVVCLETSLPQVIKAIELQYGNHSFLPDDDSVFSDFHIQIKSPMVLRRWLRPQAQFYIDGKTPFKPLPLSQAYPFFEWGLNWCIASQIHQYLILHAAVVEKNGFALILCGQPGAGKSTLCAALVNSGWRLLSDEMTVIDLTTKELISIVRPVCLKNESIDIIKRFAPQAVFGESFFDTAKGTVSHLKPDRECVHNAAERAVGKWVIFPRYVEGAKKNLQVLDKGETVIKLADNAFNYNVLGAQGFNALCDVVENCSCYDFEYSELDDAIRVIAELSC
jgi:hypothetical protein